MRARRDTSTTEPLYVTTERAITNASVLAECLLSDVHRRRAVRQLLHENRAESRFSYAIWRSEVAEEAAKTESPEVWDVLRRYYYGDASVSSWSRDRQIRVALNKYIEWMSIGNEAFGEPRVILRYEEDSVSSVVVRLTLHWGRAAGRAAIVFRRVGTEENAMWLPTSARWQGTSVV